MKAKLILLIFCFFNLNSFSQDADKELTNESIIELTKSDLSKTIILSKIENSDLFNFDTSTKGLVNLSKNSVDDDVVALMIKKQKEFSENSFKIGNVVIDKPGFYTIINDKLIEIQPHLSDAAGISGFKIKIQLNKPNADIQLSNDIKTFYYYPKEEGVNNDNTFLVSNTGNPNEATLIKFNEKRRERELQVGKIKLGGFKMSIPKKNNISFEVTEVKPDIYKIEVSDEIEKGEYGFIFGGILAGVATRVFDFSIK